MLNTVDQVAALADKVTSKGRLNVAKALASLLGRTAPWFPTQTCELLPFPRLRAALGRCMRNPRPLCLRAAAAPHLCRGARARPLAAHHCPRCAPSLRPCTLCTDSPVVQANTWYSFGDSSEYFARTQTYTAPSTQAASAQACQAG